jgi:hypothetical protein
MARQKTAAVSPTAQKATLRRRIRNFYQSFNRREWERCYSCLDPRLRARPAVEASQYADSLGAFAQSYGKVEIVHIRLSLYPDARNNKHDDRPFAYAYVFWQDDKKAFHVFRERWVNDSGRWYTRVVGLVGHEGTQR